MYKKSKLICLLLAVGILSSCTFVNRILNPNFTRITLEVETDSSDSNEVIEQAKNVIASRLYAFGVDFEFDEQKENGKQFSVKIYDTDRFQKVKKFILEEGKLELFEVVSPPNPSPVQTFPTKEGALESLGESPPSDQKVLKYADRDSFEASPSDQWIIVKTPAIVEGKDVRDASAVTRTGSESDYQISFSLKPEGAKKFGEWTGKNINNYLAVSLNDEVKSVAFIKSQIFDQGQIDGRFTKETAENLALVLKSGALPVKVNILSEESNDKSNEAK